jgi:membrane-bound serine protease (ClpP class)
MKPRRSAFVAGLALAVWPASAANRVGWIEIDGAIGPATADYVARATEVSGAGADACLIIRLDTPGGLLDSTKEIVQAIYRSPVPVVVYVAPPGANAGSAGCFITLAADVAVMAPNTSIGAAHPVTIGAPAPEGDETGGGDTMAKKIENFAVSTIEAIAERRGRNVEWARAAVRDSASITGEKALELGVIDLIARDADDLLARLDGRVVRGSPLATANAEIVPIPMLLRERVFQMLWRPEVMLLLMLIAIYGIIGELSNPGAILPGVCGAIALILALYLGAILPVNIAGLALIGLAVLLFIADAFATTHGVLTAGGIIAFFLGGMMLFDGSAPEFQLPLTMLVPATLITAAFFTFIVSAGLRAQFLPVRAGRETLVGHTGEALTDLAPDAGGRIWIEGENWEATCDRPIACGQIVRVVAVHGLTLSVQPHATETPS